MISKSRYSHLALVAICSTAAAGCDADNEKNTSTGATKYRVTADQIRAAMAAPKFEAFNTPLGSVTINRGDEATKTPGSILLNGKLIYTARSREANPTLSYIKEPFELREIYLASQFDLNKKSHRLRAVIEERNISCQYILLDFTGPQVWISERFPKDASASTGCFEMTWGDWKKNIGYFYFGDEYELWDKDGYHGWTAGYNPKYKTIIEPIYAPPPPKYCSFLPKPTNPALQEEGMPKCGDK